MNVTINSDIKFKGGVVDHFFFRTHMVHIIKVEHEKGTGYHFRCFKPSKKGESYYSLPFITQEDAEKASKIFIKNGKF